MEIKGKVALVTGGATGIGRATVLALAGAGAAGIAINYRSAKAEAEKLANEVLQAGAEPLLAQGDVKSEADVRQMVGNVEKRFRRLDILVNNAGLTHWVPVKDIHKLTDDIWDDILDVNLKGAFRCVRAAAPLLEKSRGVVINVASISGVLAPATMSSLAYGTAKAALIYLTRGLAVALAPNVRVNGVAPAFTDTPWMEKHYANNYDEIMAKAAEGYPLKRVAKPEDIAAAILGLVTGGDFVTGQTLLVDGGLSLS
ncbi:MAG TPA: SDR family oxidoreductase [Candidatus Binatia bacterium]|jgi:NAD(P)-dependent dehydrogenase (short-subunit alcohol dehydrogenase family)